MKTFKLLLETIHGPSPKSMHEEDKEIDKIHAGIHDHYIDHSTRHISAIQEFTSSHSPNSFQLNKGLLGRKPLHPDFHYLDQRLSEMMHEAPEAPHDFHVYTGIKGTIFSKQSKIRKDTKKNSSSVIKAKLPAYTSTSLRRTVASSFARPLSDYTDSEDKHLIKIHIPAGSKHGVYIAPTSQLKSENEFLLNKGKKIHIHPEPEIHEHLGIKHPKTGELSKTYIWHAKIVE